jgi:translation initiation factor 1A
MDGKKRMCTIRGSMRNRVWINAGDIVLIGLREFGDDAKADIIAKYFDEEAHELQELGELPANIQIAVGGGMGLSSGEEGEYGGESDRDEEGGPKEENKAEEKVDIDDI